MNNEVLAIIIASTLSCMGIGAGGYFLRQRKNETAQYLSTMLFCICAEIGMATTALFFLEHLWIWAALRIGGRVIEFVGVARFLTYLIKDRTGT